MLDLKTLSSTLIKNKNMNTEIEKVNCLKIKCLRYEKLSPGIIYYRYGYTGEYKIINVLRNRCRRITNHGPIDIPKVYDAQLLFSKEKKRDLFSMCEKKYIPLELHSWFQNLPVSETVRNVVPEPSETDLDFETEQ